MMIFGESLRGIGQRTVLAAERKIEALREWERGQFEGRRNLKCGIEVGWAGQFRPQTPGQHGKGGDDKKRGIKCGALHSLQSKIVIPSVSRGLPSKLPLRFRGGIPRLRSG